MSSQNTRDPKLPFGSDKCKCSRCGEYFNSTHAFSKHRVSGFQPVTRTCLTPAEMRGKGWSINRTGHWVTATREQGDEISGYPSRTPRATPNASPTAEAA